MKWTPTPIWEGEDAYVIGGGKSLEQFNWDLIRGRHSVGCNIAFRLGVDVCPVCLFGDQQFFNQNREALTKYQGLLVTCLPAALTWGFTWLKAMRRKARGLAVGNTLGWNSNTGAAALNLALSLGARRVFLLGFDMKLTAGKANWHKFYGDKADPTSYPRFIQGFHFVKTDLPQVFPGREVFNVTDDSDLNLFPKIGIREHFFGKENR